MKIVYIIPGTGGSFYCENCIRDAALVHALRRRGHQTVLAPMYLPPDVASLRRGSHTIFYGAINLYLEQVYPAYRRFPGWIKNMMNSSPLLKLAARKAGSTRPAGLDELTLSMLRGEQGNQAAELETLVTWITEHERPDLVHISNALLIGLARRIKQEAKIPVVCSLQDEDVWINALEEQAAQEAWALITQRACDVDRFIPPSHFYQEYMQKQLGLEKQRFSVVYNGIDPAGGQAGPKTGPPVIGYLSRLNRQLGLDTLTDTFISLCSQPGMEELELHLTGGHTSDDHPFIRSLLKKVKKAGLKRRLKIIPYTGEEGRKIFFREISVLSVPIPHGEAFGTFLLEALAAGVPVVQPARGAFPELVKQTGGGLIYDPDRPQALEETLYGLLKDSTRSHQLGQEGSRFIARHFNLETIAGQMERVYLSCLEGAEASRDFKVV